MILKRCRIIAAVLVLALISSLISPIHIFAESILPYYYLSGVYDGENNKYTIEVYLYTDNVLDAGTFGLEFGDEIEDKTKTFTPSEDENFIIFPGYDENGVAWDSDMNATNITSQLAFSWYINFDNPIFVTEPDPFEAVPYRLHMGTIVVEDVVMSELFTSSFSVLDWTSTVMYDTIYRDAELWRQATATERGQGIHGYYQGLKHIQLDTDGDGILDDDFYEWVDIGLEVVDPNLQDDPSDDQFAVKFTVEGYNPKLPFKIDLYEETQDMDTEEALLTYDSSNLLYSSAVTHDDRGWTTWEANLGNIPNDKKYKMVIKKTAHLTYPVIDIDPADAVLDENDKNVITLPDTITLICGDISADEIIKLPDRIMLLRVLLGQYKGEDEDYLAAADLNGDGRVTLMDLLILHTNFEKDYTTDATGDDSGDGDSGGGDSP